MNELRVLVASWPNEDRLVAEIWRGDAYVGDVRNRGSWLSVTLDPAGGRAEGIELDELLEALTQARERLVGQE